MPRPSPHTPALAAYDFAFPDTAAPQHRAHWHAFFSPRLRLSVPSHTFPLILEIGCNDASLLSTVAAAHPNVAFVGLDWKPKSLLAAAQRIAQLKLPNVALLRAKAQDLPSLFAPHELSEIWLFHPDPMDKPRELPNRLFTESFLLAAHETLRDTTSTLSLKTDHPGYYQSACSLLSLPTPDWTTLPKVRPRDLTPQASLPAPSPQLRNLYNITCNSINYWQDPAAQSHTAGKLFAPHPTPFESRFLKRHHPIYYLELQKKQQGGDTGKNARQPVTRDSSNSSHA